MISEYEGFVPVAEGFQKLVGFKIHIAPVYTFTDTCGEGPSDPLGEVDTPEQLEARKQRYMDVVVED